MPADEFQSSTGDDLGSSRRRRALRDERRSLQALLVAAIPLLVLVAVVGLGIWLMRGQDKRAANPAAPTPTHLPTLKPATLVVAMKTTEPTLVPTIATVATATESAALEPTATPEPVPSTTAVAVEPSATATAADATALVAGATARVTGTAGRGLRVRGGPSLGEPTLKLLPEETVVTILAGPSEADGYKWYQIRDEVGTEGWAAGDWLVRVQ